MVFIAGDIRAIDSFFIDSSPGGPTVVRQTAERPIMRFAPISLVAALAAISTPALAGNLEPVTVAPVAAPMAVAPVYDWTGFYVGGALGYIDAETDGGADLDGDDVFGGLRLGYDYDFGQFVVGGRFDYDLMSVDLDGAADIEEVWRLGAKAGFDSGQNWYYGTAGYAEADTDNVGSSDGWFAGLGYEVFLTQNITAGAEVLYHEFNDFDGDIDAEATTANLSINFRF
jgi:opacity protein-like surface antigen